MNEAELRHGTLPVVTAKTADRSVSVVKGKGKGKQMKLKYGFDNVFTAFSTQEEVFEETVKPVIGWVLFALILLLDVGANTKLFIPHLLTVM